MNQGPDEQLNSPLEDALLSLPQEEPPTDLQANCLTALDEASLKTGARPRWEAWRQFAAAAAVLVMMIGAGNLLFGGHVREKARAPQVRYNSIDMGPTGSMPAPPPPAGMAGPGAPGGPPSREATKAKQGADEAGNGGGRRASAPGGGPAGMPGKPTMVQGWFGEAPPQAKKRVALEMAHPSVPGAPDTYVKSAAKPASVSAAPTAADSIYRDRAVNRPAQPWEDLSDARRKVTERTIELETPTVEETYKQAVTLIEKAGGYVTQEDLTVRRQGGSQAHLDARIPVAQFDGVISQVRDLGR
ncbi:MAG: DUF4349 domain-containing protein, partial [Armatimonadota bacterium]